MADACTGAYAFRHALLQEAVYGDLLPSEQVRLHAIYARLLAVEADGAAAELAHHCLASHDLLRRPGRVGTRGRGVGGGPRPGGDAPPPERRAQAVGAGARPGRRHRHRPDQADIAGGRGGRRSWPRAQRAAALAQAAAAIADATADPARAAQAYERRGRYLFYAGQIEEALGAQASALALVPAEPPTRLRGRVPLPWPQVLIDAGRPAEARGWCEEALAVARAVGSAEDEADVLITLGRIEHYGDPANARSLYRGGSKLGQLKPATWRSRHGRWRTLAWLDERARQPGGRPGGVRRRRRVGRADRP